MPRYAETRIVPYRAEQLFDLVADVGQYPKFLPWCVGARVRRRDAREMLADLTIGFGPFRESFTSRVELTHPTDIVVHYEDGPFRFLRNHWRFASASPVMVAEGPPSTPPLLSPTKVVDGGPSATMTGGARGQSGTNGTAVDFSVDFAFRSRVLEAAIGVVFHDAVRRMVDAFLRRAEVVYGVQGGVGIAGAPEASLIGTPTPG